MMGTLVLVLPWFTDQCHVICITIRSAKSREDTLSYSNRKMYGCMGFSVNKVGVELAALRLEIERLLFLPPVILSRKTNR